jgi:hypothetical protein
MAKSILQASPFEISVGFDPRELYFIAGFSDNSEEWSYSAESAIEAIINFLNKESSHMEIKSEPRMRLAQFNPIVSIGIGKALDSLEQTARDEETTVPALLASHLNCKTLEIFIINAGAPRPKVPYGADIE